MSQHGEGITSSLHCRFHPYGTNSLCDQILCYLVLHFLNQLKFQGLRNLLSSCIAHVVFTGNMYLWWKRRRLFQCHDLELAVMIEILQQYLYDKDRGLCFTVLSSHCQVLKLHVPESRGTSLHMSCYKKSQYSILKSISTHCCPRSDHFTASCRLSKKGICASHSMYLAWSHPCWVTYALHIVERISECHCNVLPSLATNTDEGVGCTILQLQYTAFMCTRSNKDNIVWAWILKIIITSFFLSRSYVDGMTLPVVCAFQGDVLSMLSTLRLVKSGLDTPTFLSRIQHYNVSS